jgi:integrase/recombinase XerD
LGQISVGTAVLLWLDTFGEPTRLNYECGFTKLVELGFLNVSISLQQFALANHEDVIDRIKLVRHWKEGTRQARAAAYISFTGFLARRSEGIVRKAVPSREGNTKTFYKVREKVDTRAMNRSQWTCFLSALKEVNYRDWIIAQTILQGGKRVSEVLSLTRDQVDIEEKKVRFIQSKTKGMHKEIVITYPEQFMRMLSEYIADREGLVFVTKFGKSVDQRQVRRTFSKAGEIAGIPFRVSPHVLRASVVTYLKNQGFADSEIMKITGHASAEMVHAYDKSSQEDNLSSHTSLI